MQPRTSLRPATPADADFLRNLFSADKAAEFAAQGVPEPIYQPLIDMQYRSRAATYSAEHPEATTWIIECFNSHAERSEVPASGTPVAVGQFVLAETPQASRLIDLVIQPQFRNRSIATQVLQQLKHQTAAAGQTLSLRVAKNNPAQRLYARMGFKTVAEDEIAYEMICNPGTRPTTASPS